MVPCTVLPYGSYTSAWNSLSLLNVANNKKFESIPTIDGTDMFFFLMIIILYHHF